MEMNIFCHAFLDRNLDFSGQNTISPIINDLDVLQNSTVLFLLLTRVEDSMLNPCVIPQVPQLELVDQSVEAGVVASLGNEDFPDFDERAEVRNQREWLLDINLISV